MSRSSIYRRTMYPFYTNLFWLINDLNIKNIVVIIYFCVIPTDANNSARHRSQRSELLVMVVVLTTTLLIRLMATATTKLTLGDSQETCGTILPAPAIAQIEPPVDQRYSHATNGCLINETPLPGRQLQSGVTHVVISGKGEQINTHTRQLATYARHQPSEGMQSFARHRALAVDFRERSSSL